MSVTASEANLNQKKIERDISNSSGNSSPVIVSANVTPTGGNSPILEGVSLPSNAKTTSTSNTASASATASASIGKTAMEASTAAAKSKSDSQSSTPVIVSPLGSARKSASHSPTGTLVHVDNLTAHISDHHLPSAVTAFSNTIPPIHPGHPVHPLPINPALSKNSLLDSGQATTLATTTAAAQSSSATATAVATVTATTTQQSSPSVASAPKAPTILPPAQVKSGGVSPEGNQGSPTATPFQVLKNTVNNTASHANNTDTNNTELNIKSDKDSSAALSQARRFSVGGEWVTVPATAAVLQTNQPKDTGTGSGSGSLVSTPQASSRAADLSVNTAISNTATMPANVTATSITNQTTKAAIATSNSASESPVSISPIHSSKPLNAVAEASHAATAAATSTTNTSANVSASATATSATKKEIEDILTHNAKGSPSLVCVVVADEAGHHDKIDSVPHIPLEHMYFQRESEGGISHSEGKHKKNNSATPSPTGTKTETTTTLTKSNSTSALMEIGTGSSNENSRDTSPRDPATGTSAPSRSILRTDVPLLNMQAVSGASKGVSSSAAVSQSKSTDTKLAAESNSHLATNFEQDDDLNAIQNQINDFKKEENKVSLEITEMRQELVSLQKKLAETILLKQSKTPSVASDTGPILELLGGRVNTPLQDSKSQIILELEKNIASKEKKLRLWSHRLESISMNIEIFTQSILDRSTVLNPVSQHTASISTATSAEIQSKIVSQNITIPLPEEFGKTPFNDKKTEAQYSELERLKKEQARLALTHAEEATRLKQTVLSLQAEKEKQSQLHEHKARNLTLQLETLQKEQSALRAAQQQSDRDRKIELESMQKEKSLILEAQAKVQADLKDLSERSQREGATLTERQKQLADLTAQLTQVQTHYEKTTAERNALNAQLGAKDEQINKQTIEINQLMTQQVQHQLARAQELANARAAGSAETAAAIKARQQKVF